MSHQQKVDHLKSHLKDLEKMWNKEFEEYCKLVQMDQEEFDILLNDKTNNVFDIRGNV